MALIFIKDRKFFGIVFSFEMDFFFRLIFGNLAEFRLKICLSGSFNKKIGIRKVDKNILNFLDFCSFQEFGKF